MATTDYGKFSPFNEREGQWLASDPEPDDLLNGQSTMARREIINNNVSTSSGSIRFTFFTAKKTETVSSVWIPTGTTAAAGATFIRIGIYREETNNDLTLVASTANDTTLFAAITTGYTKALQAPVELVKGRRYCVAIAITATTVPTFYGGGTALNLIVNRDPKLCSYMVSADLPASILSANLSAASGSQMYAEILP